MKCRVTNGVAKCRRVGVLERRESRRVGVSAYRRIGFTLLALIVAMLFVSCKRGGAGAKPADVDYYTCTMHPSVRSQDPKAKCPICSMDLVPVKKQGPKAEKADEHAGHNHAAASAEKPADGGMAGMAMPAGAGEKMPAEEKPHEFTVP